MSAFKKMSEEENVYVASVLSFFFGLLSLLCVFYERSLAVVFFFQAFAYVAIYFPILINSN